MEDEPKMNLNLGDGRELEATRQNSSLFRFFGKLAMYDHIFVLTDEEKGIGCFIFNTHAVFEDLADHMMAFDYPAHLNLAQVAQCDIDAFDNMIAKDASDDLENGIPEDWS